MTRPLSSTSAPVRTRTHAAHATPPRGAYSAGPCRALMLAAGAALSLLSVLPGTADGAVLTFNPTCAPFTWSSTCTQFNACGAGNTQNINSNNWGSVVCGAPALFPGASDMVVFAGNGTIDTATQVQRVTINPGVTVAFGAGYNATDGLVGFLNNGTLNSIAGNQSWTGSFQNNGSFTEDNGGWTRGWNSVAFSNAGTLNLPGSTTWAASSGSNSLSNLGSGTINKTAGGTFSTNVGITNGGAINVTGGTFRLFNSQFQGNGGTITTSGTSEFLFENATLALTISGTSNSSIRSTGTLTIAGGPGATLNIGGNGLALSSNLALNGVLTNSNRVATLGGNQTWGGGTLTNNGIWTEDGAGWSRNWNSFTFNNNGTLNLPGGVNWSVSSGSNTLNNSGTINKTAGGTFATNVAVANSPGTIALATNGGTFQMSGSYSGSGQLLPQSGSEVLFNGTFFDGNNGAVTGTVPAGASIRTTGTITGSGFPPNFNVQGQGITFDGNFGGATGFRNSGVARTAAGNQTWNANQLINDGTWTEDSAGWIRSFVNCTFTNNSVLNLPGSVSWNVSSGSPRINNNATINKTGGGTFSTNMPVTNASTGSVVVAANGGTFRVDNTVYSGTGQLAVQGASGEVLFNNTFFDGNSGVVTGSVAPGGSMRTTGTISSAGIGATFNISGEGIAFDSNFGGAALFRNNGIARTLAGNRTWNTNQLINNGTWTEDSGGWTRALANTQFTNNGTLNLPGSTVWNVSSGSPSITNNATINKTAGGTFSTNTPVTNAGFIDLASGSFNMTGGFTQSAANARTQIRSGASITGSPLTIAGGRVEGRGTISQNVTTTGSAIIAPGDGAANGTLTFANQLTMSASGTLEVNISTRPNASIDRILTANQLSVAGTCRVIVSSFIPTLGDVYEIARSNTAQRTGAFAPLQVIAEPGIAFSLSYTPTSVLLTVTDTICDSVDFNNDQVFPDDQDLADFIFVLGGGSCPTCNDVDFNNDGVFPDDQDLQAFLLILGGGSC